MSSFEWMASKGAPLLPKVLPFYIPERMMELKRRPTIYDIRGSGWQLRKRHAPRDQLVPWDRVYFWPHKAVHEITPQELDPPAKRRRKRVAQKGPKLVKAPSPASRTKEVSVKHTMRYQFKRVLRRVKDLADRRTIDAFLGRPSRPVAAPAASADAAPHAPSPALRALYTLPGTFPDDGAAAAVDAQIEAAAERDEKPPSFVFALVNFGVDAYIAGRKRKRARELDEAEEAGDAKRRRVESDAQAPSRADARPVAGRPTRDYITTGATAPTLQNLTAAAASRAARPKPKPTLELCPPPTGPAPAIDPEKLLPPSQAKHSRPIAGRSQPKRADTPIVAPRASTPIPTAGEVLSGQPVCENVDQPEPRAPSPSRSRSQSRSPSPSSRSSSPSSSSSSSRSSSRSPSRSPSPEPEPDGDFVPGPTMVSMLPPGTRNGKDGNDLFLFPWHIAWDLRASGRPALPRVSEPAPVADDDAPACVCTICARAIAARAAAAAAAASASIPALPEDTLASLLEMSRPKPSGSTELVDDGEETEVESNSGGSDDEDSDTDSSA